MTTENTAPEEQTTTPVDNTEETSQTQDTAEESGETDAEGTETEAKEPDETEGIEGKDEGQAKEKSDWRLKRINQLTYKNKQLEEEAANVKKQNEIMLAKIAALQNGQNANPAEAEAEIKKLAEQMAEDIAAHKIAAAQFNRDADRVHDKGVNEYDDFKECLENLNGSFGERWNNAIPLIVDALEEAPHKVIHHLGTNLDEANRILSLSPARQVAELTKLEAKLSKPESKPISKAPNPIKPVEGRVSTPLDLTKTDNTAEWIKMRNKQIEAEKAAKRR